MTKKIYFLLAFLLTTLGGGNLALAVTHELRMGETGNTDPRESTDGGAYGALNPPSSYFSFASGYSISGGAKYTGKYAGVTYSAALKFESNKPITFTTSAVSTIYVVQCTKITQSSVTSDNNEGISLKVGSAAAVNYAYNDGVVTTLSDDNNENVRVYTITDVAAGECQISRYGGESGIFYVKVVEASINTVTLTSSHGTDLTNGEMVIAGTQKNFTVTVGATHNASNATFSYSGSKYNVSISAGVLTISAKAGQTYGTETITVNVPAEGDYPAGSATLNVTYWTGDISNEYSAANVGRKWTFNHAWTNSALFYNNESTCGWTKSGNHFEYQRTDISSNAETAQVCDTYVEQMYGLKVKQDAAGKVWMQSTNDTYYLAIQNGGTIVIPNVPSGKTVRVNAFSQYGGKMYFNGGDEETVTAGSANASDFIFTTSSTGDVEITTSSSETIYFNSIVIEGNSTGDVTVRSAPYTWNFENGSSTWGNTAHQVSNVYSDWNYGGDTYYNTNTGIDTGQKGYVIDAIKGLRFEDIPYLGLDWGYGHIWMGGDAAKITIPNLQANQVVTFVMEGREGEVATGTSSSVSATNTDKSSSISIPRTDENWTNYDFKVDANGSATFTFEHAVSIRKIIIRKAAPTLVWTETGSETLTTPSIVYGQGTTVTHTATASVTDGGTVPAVKYRSGNTEIATVDNTGKVTPRSAGTVQIYAYTEAGDYATKEISYSLTITEGTADFTFVPQKGKVGVGKWIIPRLRFPSIAASAVTTLKVSMVEILDGDNNVTATYDDDSEIATYFGGSPGFTVENYDNLKNSWETNAETPIGVHKVNVKFTGVTEGTKARVTVSFESNGFVDATTQYTIEVTAENAVNFDWKSGTPSEVYIYENTYMPIPHLSGNANGNNHYSNGSVNESTYRAYVYEIKQKDNTFRIKWNNKDYKLKEGVPDYYLTDESDATTTNAYLFWAKSDNEEYSDTLLVYAKTAGTVRLHAKDSQNNQECGYITIHIVANNLDTQAATAVSANTYPFTWDFTGNNISASDLRGSQYWDEVSTGQFHNTALWQNTDFADSDQDDATTNRLPKYFLTGASSDTNGGTLMPFFKGMKVILGNSTYNSKIHKIRVSTNATAGEAKVYFSGGTHELILPRLGVTSSEPANYKLYVKVKGADNSTELAFRRNGANISGASYKGTSQISNTESSIFSVDVDKNDVMSIYVANLHIYWIALSTEVKNVVCPRDANSNLNYAAASYSYPEDLDLSKSAEVNDGVAAYYASSCSFNKDAAATGTDGCAVVMTQAPTTVPANTGLILKKNTTEASTSCYMIANGKNVASYVAPSALTTNYLKATDGGIVSSNETIGDDTYTNFAMSYAYKMYHDPMNPGSVYTGYLYDRPWSFYKIMGNVSISEQKSYLQIPGNLYVDREGNVVQGASRRAADDNRPSTKPMLDIIYEDEPLGDPNVTGISTVSDRLIDNDAWYTLQGIRVDAPAKGGIYIHNGRKVVIK